MSNSDNNCISRVVPKVTDYQVFGADLDSLLALFKSNNLSIGNLQFQYLAVWTIVSTNYNGIQEQVMASQFYNGLPVFLDNDFFIFNAGKFELGDGNYGFTGIPPGSDTTGHQTLIGLRCSFLKHVSESVFVGEPNNSTPSKSKKNYADSWLLATLGYLDASMFPGKNTAVNKVLVKVWKITSLNGSFPLVYVEDDTGLGWGVTFIVP